MEEPKQPSTEAEPDECDAPVTAEEVARAEELRESLSGSGGMISLDTTFALSLRAAWTPTNLAGFEIREVLEERPTPGEVELAIALRSALHTDREPDSTAAEAVQVARSLRAAWAAAELDETEHRAMIMSALAQRIAVSPRARFGPHRFTAARGALMGALALAASVTLVWMQPTEPVGTLAGTRTTQPLFAEPFRSGEASARVDRIAAARVSDFRDNRFAAWGIP